MNEFGIIEKFFKKKQNNLSNELFHTDLMVGIGDDAAILKLSKNFPIAVSTDILVSGIHFSPTQDPRSIGYKSLAVNLSDIAAMGADPFAFTLGLGLSSLDEFWLESFSEGLFEISRQFNCDLIGGDTVSNGKSPSFITITILGSLILGKALRRDGRMIEDDIWVSGDLGEPSAALLLSRKSSKLSKPSPRVKLGKELLGVANSCIDLSDGFTSDLRHMMKSSFSDNGADVEAELYFEDILNCISKKMRTWFSGTRTELDLCLSALGGGDEYELCFSAPEKRRMELESISKSLNIPLTRVGKVKTSDVGKNSKFNASMKAEPKLTLISRNKKFDKISLPSLGFKHF